MQYRVTLKLKGNNAPHTLGFGRGVVELLNGVDQYGSLHHIAKEMGMAYSKAWTVLRRTEEELGIKLLDREGAHGSTLTPEAHILISRYKEMLQAADDAAHAVFVKYYGE